MSLNATLRTATSGMMAAQTGLRTVSDNIANVNTPGYVRKTVDQGQIVINGVGMGVEVSGVKRVTDQYLQLASLTASSEASRWDAFSSYMDNAQSLFGDPSSATFFFNRLDKAFAAFATAADDPSSSLLRSQALSNVQDFLGEADRITDQLDELKETVDGRVKANVDRANDLLAQIDRLNADISRAQLVDQDASGAQNIQAQLIDELATLMSVKVAQRPLGGVTIRSPEGVMLAGEGASTLVYNRTEATRGYITAMPPGGVGRAAAVTVSSGEIRGLLDLRDDKLPGMADQLGEFVARAVDKLNAAHNAYSAIPAPTSLVGRATGLDLPTALSGFTGKTAVAILDANGVVQRRIDVDFAANNMTVNGGPFVPFTPANFLSTLNTSLGAFGSATFTGGVLQINATGANGVAIDESTSSKAGKGFSHFFGMNDLVQSSGFTNYETGLKTIDPHGFTPGGQISFQLAQPDGTPLKEVTVTVPALANMSDLLAALNNNSTGVGIYGQFSLNAEGALSFTGTPPTDATLAVTQDNTQRGAGGPGISELFGLGVGERTARAGRFTVSAALLADPTKLAFAKLNLAVPGEPALRAGDGRGALALADAGDVVSKFQAAGGLGSVSMTISRYAAEFGGSIGRDAADAETRKESAESVMGEATARRQSVEGVNLNEELVRLSTYQQAFNASARMIQAAKDLFDVLTQMI